MWNIHRIKQCDNAFYNKTQFINISQCIKYHEFTTNNIFNNLLI